MSKEKRTLDFKAGNYYENSFNAGWHFFVKKSSKASNGTYTLEGKWYESNKGKRKDMFIDQTVVVTKDAIANWTIKS